MKKLDLRWCKNLKDPGEAKAFERFVQGSWPVLDRLKEIIEEMDVSDAPSKKQDYNNPSWAYRQADHNGYARALKSIKDLIGEHEE